VSNVATGIGFFDHMLDLLARHSPICRWTRRCHAS
jgi:imidazoleglycerol phosphate dehydratase HisB